MYFLFQLYRRRRDMAQKYAPLRRHIGILDQLGAQGMSSDESVTTPNAEGPTYHYLHSDWRADEVSVWLDDFDTVYYFDRANESDRRGAYPHRRNSARPQKLSLRSRPIHGLPINTYKSSWLSTKLPSWVKSVLRPSTQRYVFSNDADLMRLDYLRFHCSFS